MRLNKILLLFVSLLVLVAGAPVTAATQEVTQTDNWKSALELYFWGASIGGKSASGSDIDIELDDILDSLELVFMGAAGVSKGKWTLAVDLIYLDVEESDAIRPNLNATVKLTNWIITPVVGYNLVDTEKSRLDILGGARYLHMKADLQTVALTTRRAEDSGSNWDAIIGARGDVDLAEKWYLFGYLDIGTGESDLTWQALTGIGYKFKRFDVRAVYRYLSWDFDDNPVLDELDISGPAVGIRFLF